MIVDSIPAGSIGPEKPFLAASSSAIYLLTGKPENGGASLTNSVQVDQTVLLAYSQ